MPINPCNFLTTLKSSLDFDAMGQSLIFSQSHVEYSKLSSWVFISNSCIRLVSSSLTSSEIGGAVGGVGVEVVAVMLGLNVCVFVSLFPLY